MKRILLLTFFVVFLLNCKSQISKKDTKYILNTALKIYKENHSIYNDNFIVLSSAYVNDTVFYKNGKFGLGITIMDSKSTYGLNYKKLYSYGGIVIVSKDSLKIFKSLLTPIPYKDINKSHIKELNYDPFNITLIFNKKSELLYTFPEHYEYYFKNYKKNID
ncbi:hypothetical protein C8D70_11110 [Chryseobacterium sp. CBTAP 102]|uniref:hypothetical protein n=1 Tax=Chryseobacterium sp. CBTAP 102 TaxID=2135644 RepID=UPI000D761EB2|nr:hypothetical protein [Chryseobacterium sp. CBTAP 102]PXW12540.1 hypothetical protein C8D70_11110 [Chryseobacterium sp. CBTAP 102]